MNDYKKFNNLFEYAETAWQLRHLLLFSDNLAKCLIFGRLAVKLVVFFFTYFFGILITQQLLGKIIHKAFSDFALGFTQTTTSTGIPNWAVVLGDIFTFILGLGITGILYESAKYFYKRAKIHPKMKKSTRWKIILPILTILLWGVFVSTLSLVFANMKWWQTFWTIINIALAVFIMAFFVSSILLPAFPKVGGQILSKFGYWRISDKANQEIVISIEKYCRKNMNHDEIVICEDLARSRLAYRAQVSSKADLSLAFLGSIAAIVTIVFSENLAVWQNIDLVPIGFGVLVIIWLWVFVNTIGLQSPEGDILAFVIEACILSRSEAG